MKNYNDWIKITEGAQIAQKPTQEKEKEFNTTDNSKITISKTLDMLAYSIDLFINSNNNSDDVKAIQAKSSEMKIGDFYLYTDKEGNKFPVKVISVNHQAKKDNSKDSNVWIEDEVKKPRFDDAVQVQRTNTLGARQKTDGNKTDKNAGPKGVIGGTNSKIFGVNKDKLEPMTSDFEWWNKDLKTLINDYKNAKNDVIKNMISTYIYKILISKKSEELKKLYGDKEYESIQFMIKTINSQRNKG